MHKTNTSLAISSLRLGDFIYVFSVILLLSTLLSSSILTSFYVSADDSVVDEINITVPVSCTLSSTGMNTHVAEISNGLYRSDIGITSLKAFCNDNNGFAIYAAGYTGNKIGQTNSNKLVGTSASGNATIDTGLATSGNISNWAMKLTATSDSGDTTGTNALTIDSAPNLVNGTPTGANASFSQYHTVPNEYTKVAHKNSSTDMNESTGGATITSTYAAYISKTQLADTYSGQVIYTLVHPATALAPVICNPDGTTISTIVCMQDLSNANRSSVLASMIEDEQYQLYDSRDNKQYYVAKLKDGNIWMTQNLDLDLDSTRTYTNEDTDIGWNTNTNTYDPASWRPTFSTRSSNNNLDIYSGSYYPPSSYDPGNLYWNGLYDDGNLNWDTYETSCGENWDTCDDSLQPTISSVGIPQHHLGNYYSWTAAIAVNDSSAYVNNFEPIERSICPSGWTLPRITSVESSFAVLFEYRTEWDNSIDGKGQWEAALVNTPYFTLGGESWNHLLSVGYEGKYWSSSAASIDYARYMPYTWDYGPNVGQMVIDRGTEISVRCIARPIIPYYND